MTQKPVSKTPCLWARFRFSVVGSLRCAPLARGELQATLQALADKTWTHPVNGGAVNFSAATIQRFGSLWHLDFHHGSLPVLTPRGQFPTRTASRSVSGRPSKAA